MTQVLQKFLNMVAEIASEKPTYRQPGTGDDGTCDCIGLIIGALRRMGIKWNGIHGTNYAVRKASVNFRKITSASQLEVGDAVYKACEKGDAEWTLDKYPRYLPGGAYYNGDLLDYYHVGVVTSVNPLRITHMTTPTIKVDTSLGKKWRYAARIKPLVNAGAYAGSSVPSANPDAGKVQNEIKAVVTAQNGSNVRMRQKPSTSCKVYDLVPIGATVKVIKSGQDWSQISYGKRSGWYMMTKFLKITK